MTRRPSLRLACALVRVASMIAPRASRERMRREWEAELAAASVGGEGGSLLVRSALGAFADARALWSIEWKRSMKAEDVMRAWTSGWVREITVAVRSLLRAPAYTAVAVVTLALGLGGSAAIYTLLEHVVLSPLPYPEPDRLVKLDNPVPGVEPDARWNTSFPQYIHFTDHSETLDAVGIYWMGGANMQTPSGPERVRSATITAEVLTLLGARAHVGRTMTVEDNLPGAPPVVVLSHGFWSRALGADAGIVGRTLTLDDSPFEVIGVLEPGTELPDAPPGFSTDVWRPFTIDRSADFYNSHTYRMVARLAADADTAAAEAELAQLTLRLPEAYPLAYTPAFFERTGFRTDVTPLKSAVVGDAARSLWIVFAGVGLVLLIACANVANLFLVRMEARRRELAVRAALGAGRGQVARYLVAEGIVLAGTGAALALLLGQQAVGALGSQTLEGLPRLDGLALGSSTVLLTVALAALVGVGLALHPLFLHTRAGPAHALAEGGRGGGGGPSGSRFRGALVVTQVAMALVLAISAGLLMESMRRLTRLDPGFEPEGVLALHLTVTQARYPDDAALWRFYRDVLAGVRAVPGVMAAGMSAELPLQGAYGCTIQWFEEDAVRTRLQEAGLTSCAGQEPTTAGYFEAMGLPILAGRPLEDADADDPTRAAVVVSQTFAERFWPGEDPIGKRVAPSGRSRGYHTVVGVVGDVPSETLDGERAVAIYYPVVVNPETDLSLWPGQMNLVVKMGNADPSAVVAQIREAVAAVDPEVPLTNVREMADVIDVSTARLSFTALLLGVAAGTALLLAAVGLYGVVSYTVTRRTREIGMRIAIGARPGQVEWLVVARSLALAGVGLLIGVAAALAGTRVLTGLLYGVDPTDPIAFLAAAGLLLLVALLASWIPARRAARVDPSTALREA